MAVAPLLRVSIAYLAYFAAVGAAWPYLPIYYRGIGLSLGTIGGLAAVAAAIQLLAAPGWGVLADHFSRTRLTLPAASGSSPMPRKIAGREISTMEELMVLMSTPSVVLVSTTHL